MKNCILKPLLFIFALLLSVLIFSSCNNGESNVILTDDNTDNTTALDSECTNDSYTTDSDSTVDELTTEEETYAYEDGIDRILSTEGLCELSSNKNLIVFLVDRFDSRYVELALKSTPDVFNSLDGFTYFDDCISLYGRTFPSVAYMLTGVENDFSKLREDYFREAYKNSEFLNVLKKNNYKIKIYTDSYYAYDDASVMGRYASNICDSEYSDRKYTTDQKNVFDYVSNSSFTVNSTQNNFSFIHIQGCHLPNTYDESFNKMDENSSDRWNELVAINTSMQIINVYINQLKEKGLYESSTIIIIGDHAAAMSDSKELSGVRRTAMLVKPSGISNGDIKISSSYVSHENLWATALKCEGLSYEYNFAPSAFDVGSDKSTVRRYVFQRMDDGFFENITYSILGSSKYFDNWTIINRENIEGSVHR